MKVFKRDIDDLTIRKIIYIILWSVGLFVATFYGFCGSFDFAEMKKMTALKMANDYLFPLFMAMALFLLDAQYVMVTEGRQFTKAYSACVILFLLATVVSILVNNSVLGWVFFIGAWIALTVLKASMILDVNGIEIDSK